MLQLILPDFTVDTTNDLNVTHPDGNHIYKFKHGTWNQFICSMDKELRTNYYQRHQELPNKYGLVWLGKKFSLNF
jgi:hypothetical protein